MDATLLSAFEDAQRRTIRLARAVVEAARPGMTERDVAGIAREEAPRFGFRGWFFPPEIQVGAHTRQAGVWRIPSARVRLAAGDLLMVCLGPWDGTAFGDFATTVAVGGPEPDLVRLARECTRATCGYVTRWKCVGEIYVFARSWAANHRLDLANRRSIGHVLLPPANTIPLLEPREAHARTWLRRYQVQFLNPRPARGLLALGPQVVDGRRGARFREVVLVEEGEKRVLGRPDSSAIGTL